MILHTLVGVEPEIERTRMRKTWYDLVLESTILRMIQSGRRATQLKERIYASGETTDHDAILETFSR
jgi:hypothetical protein